MKVLFAVDGLWVGGTERSLSEMLPKLIEAGLEPAVACLRHRAEGVEEETRRQGVVIHQLKAPGLFSQVKALRRLLQSEAPHVLHTSLFRANLVGRLAAIGRASVVVNSLVNTPYAPVRLQDPAVRRAKLRAVQWIDSLTARLTDQFHAVSQAAKAAAVRDLSIPPRKIEVIERGRDVERLGEPSPERRRAARRKLGFGDEAQLVVNVGRQDYQKGQTHLLRATARLAATHPRLIVLVAGRPGGASAELEAAHRDTRLEGRVRLLGHRDDIPEILAAANIFAFPSLFEGLPGAVLEAMALALPVVAADIPAVREIVEPERSALLVTPGDPEELAGALASLLKDPARAQALGSRGRQIFEERFTLEKSAARMIAFYRDLADKAV